MITKTPRAKIGPRTRQLAERRLRNMISDLNEESMPWEAQRTIPEAWATLEDDIICEEPKVKITLRLDASVAKYYRAMGKGYQARMNRILATYAQLKIAQVRWYEGGFEEARHQAQREAFELDKGGADGGYPVEWHEE